MDISLNMPSDGNCREKEQGYVLVVVIFILLLLTVTVVALNRRAGLQAKIAANQVRTVQTQFGQLAAFEHAAWQLRSDPDLRTDTAGDSYEFDDVVYNRKIIDSTHACPPNVIMVSITAPGGRPPVTAGIRIRYAYQDTVYIADTENNKIKKVDHTGLIYTVPTPELDKPHGVAVDASGNIYIADTHNDRIIRVDTSDAAEVLATGFIDEPHGLFVQDGTVEGWGNYNAYYIRNVEGTTSVIAVEAAGYASFALTSEGTVWMTGIDTGNGATGCGGHLTPWYHTHTTPYQVVGEGGNGYLTNIVAIDTGEFHGVAVKSNGDGTYSYVTWGNNVSGMLGNGSTTNSWAPVQVSGF